MDICMLTKETKNNAHNQLVYSNPKRDELIVLTPVIDWVLRNR